MKQHHSALLSVFISTFFFISCKKEILSIPENVQPSSTSIINESSASLVNTKMNRTVPFKGEYATVAQFIQGPAVQIITGTGHATHLGESRFVANATVNLTTPPPFAIAGTAVFTASNGDQFYTAFTGTSTPTGPGTSRGILNHRITGGTGRFEDATGAFTGIALVNAASPVNSVRFEGSINY